MTNKVRFIGPNKLNEDLTVNKIYDIVDVSDNDPTIVSIYDDANDYYVLVTGGGCPVGENAEIVTE